MERKKVEESPRTRRDVDARWDAIEAMSAEDFAEVAARVSICLYCLGPALLTDEEIEATIAEPLCRRCRAQVVAA